MLYLIHESRLLRMCNSYIFGRVITRQRFLNDSCKVRCNCCGLIWIKTRATPVILVSSCCGFVNGTCFCNVKCQPDVLINCAAISVPRACEDDPAAAMSINVPSSLVKWLSGFKDRNTLLIHLSTDQVYEGSKSFYKEEDDTAPVNVYGRSKVQAEKLISANWSNFAILRSSIIVGPQTLSPIPKSLPIQWIDNVLSEGNKVNFFYDEFHCPVYVKDVVATILALTEKWFSDGKQMQLLLNLGGPDRLSRAQMADCGRHQRIRLLVDQCCIGING